MVEFRVDFKDDTAEIILAEDFETNRMDNGDIVLRFVDSEGEFVAGASLGNIKMWRITNAE